MKEKSEKFKQINESINLKKAKSLGLDEQIEKKAVEKQNISNLIPELEKLKPQVEEYEIIKNQVNSYDQLKLKAQQRQNYQDQITKLNESIQKDTISE